MAKLQQQQQELPVELNSNEMYQHVQHDWNFGDIKLSSSQSSGDQQRNLSHEAIDLMDVVQDADVIDDIMHNDVCHDVLGDEDEGDQEEDEDDEVVECMTEEQQLIDEDSEAVREIVDKLQQHQQQQNQQQHHQQLHIQDVVQLAQHSFMPQAHSEFGNDVSPDNENITKIQF